MRHLQKRLATLESNGDKKDIQCIVSFAENETKEQALARCAKDNPSFNPAKDPYYMIVVEFSKEGEA